MCWLTGKIYFLIIHSLVYLKCNSGNFEFIKKMELSPCTSVYSSFWLFKVAQQLFIVWYSPHYRCGDLQSLNFATKWHEKNLKKFIHNQLYPIHILQHNFLLNMSSHEYMMRIVSNRSINLYKLFKIFYIF